ncbi:hypothetical protein AKJ09_09134 [Labilithrix luteola]|uniref:Uncharacterized protein n=1 Tax=Labilithrix luteola TaxID=1391654 RepID=A0A0K1Q9J8_9BACT|nr:hypothetical protein [Labilithrix luteola]AKV02471.1 hypothetical protein AKJ09_09134 [Labilithrix luteola]
MRHLLRTAPRVLGALVPLLVPLACSAFGGDASEATHPDAASTSDDAAALPPDAEADAADVGEAGLEQLPVLHPVCPPPRAPLSCSGADCKTRLLYEPPTRPRFPFAITTDGKFVYWVEQDTNGDGYNGNAKARILRVPRAGGDAVEIAAGQDGTTALALDGEYVYWANYEGGAAPVATTIMRAPRRCPSSACPAEPFVRLNVSGRVTELVRGKAGVLFARASSAALIRIDTSLATPPRTASLTAVASGLAVGGASVYVAISASNFVAYAPDLASWSTFTPIATDTAVTSLTSDCTSLWATTKTDYFAVDEVSHTAAVDVKLALPDVFDSAVDAKFVYVARANAGGVEALDKFTGVKVPIWSGNVFALDVDDEGVYWGDHAPATGGNLYVMEK